MGSGKGQAKRVRVVNIITKDDVLPDYVAQAKEIEKDINDAITKINKVSPKEQFISNYDNVIIDTAKKRDRYDDTISIKLKYSSLNRYRANTILSWGDGSYASENNQINEYNRMINIDVRNGKFEILDVVFKRVTVNTNDDRSDHVFNLPIAYNEQHATTLADAVKIAEERKALAINAQKKLELEVSPKSQKYVFTEGKLNGAARRWAENRNIYGYRPSRKVNKQETILENQYEKDIETNKKAVDKKNIKLANDMNEKVIKELGADKLGVTPLKLKESDNKYSWGEWKSREYGGGY